MAISELYKNLIIFDGKGNPIPRTLVDDVYVSNINLKKHAVYIPEHVTLYLMEKFIDNNTGLLNVMSVANDEDISLNIYGVGYNFCEVVEENFINKISQIIYEKNIVYTKVLGEEGYFDNVVGLKPLSLNILHIGESEDFFSGNISIFVGGNLLWKISLYTETEDEDERYVELLDNIGESVTNRHELIFKDSDINEDLPNSMLLNDKRKEFLTVINEITPFISSVRGILQIIDFFDYKNIVEIKEYWYNQVEDKIRIVPITEVYKDTTDIKLQQFGLFYKINHPTEEFDEDGLPIVEDSFLMSHEEVLVKLFALKDYFIEKDYGGISDIVDIIGEVYNYQLLLIKHWKTTTDVLIYDHIPVANVKVNEGDNYILPITEPQESHIESYKSIIELSAYKLYEIGKHSFTHFKGYFNGEIRINDDGIIEVGAKITITNTTFKDKIKDMNYCWNSGSMVDVWWYNAFAPSYYKIQYIISRNVNSINADGRTFNKIYAGGLFEMNEIQVTVPYDGWYDVTIMVIGYDGIVTSSYIKKAFEVILKDANFMFMYKIFDEKIQKFSTSDMTWAEINQEFTETVNYNDNLESKEDIASPIYSHIDRWEIDGGALKQRFRENKFSFKEYSMISFKDTYYDSEDIQRFVYSGIIPDSSVQINEDELIIPQININEYALLETVFRNVFRTDYQYIYKERLNHGLIEGLYNHFGYEGNTFIGSSEDNLHGEDKMEYWKDVNESFYVCPLSFRNTRSIIYTKFKPSSLTVANTKSFMNEVDLPKTIPLIFSLENAYIYGKKDAKWEIFDSNNRIIYSSTGLMSAFQFKNMGLYSLNLQVTDINGNKYSIRKNNIINVMSDFEYLKNYKYVKR